MAAFSVRHSWAKPLTMGFMGATTHTTWSAFIAAFESRLRQRGWINGHNIDIDYRWAEGRDDRYAKVAKDFVRRKVDIIVATGTPAALAAKKATKKIPIVFAVVGDPVGTKLVTSLAHPGGNITGLSNGQTNLAARRLDELRKAIPSLKRLALTRIRRLSREAAGLADRVIATDHATLAEVEAHLGVEPEKVVVVPNGIDAGEIRSLTPADPARDVALRLPALGDAAPVFLSVGRLEAYKGFADVADALRRASDRLPQRWAWVVVGDGPLRETLRGTRAFRRPRAPRRPRGRLARDLFGSK